MSFPLADLVPKKETNVIEFLREHPDYDGRNVTIGILDTGIDPGAHGISCLPDGITPKLIDILDCSGSGDVDVSTEVEATWGEENGNSKKGTEGGHYWKVKGLTGRSLKLSADWSILPFPESSNKDEETDDKKNETKKRTVPVRIGIKAGYDLFPPRLVTRVKQARRKIFNEQVDSFVANIRGNLADWKDTYGKSPTYEQIRVRDDLQAQLDALTSKEWDTDPGPLYDCVVFYDGNNYRAVILDVEDMRHAKPITSFSKEREYGTFGTVDQLNYTVNFYDNAKILSICTDATPHGTHVAAISAAAEGERSGVAPGAKLVSFKIGDTRMNGMETGSALTRAMIEAVKHKCDVINLSYGEGSAVPDRGRFVELAEELVWKHNIIFVSAAGNEGPALSTVGTPGGTTSALIGVAAYVSPDMMKAAYSMSINEAGEGDDESSDTEQHLGTTYTWSSVGPATDGDNGVNVTAPGGAITSVSNWCLQKSRLMNGTSMSSPHVTGCIALLLSACKAEGIKASPARIRRALENTADLMPNLSPLQQGHGMIQVDKAFEYLKTHKEVESEDIFFSVRVENRSGNPRGIYLRQMEHTSTRQTFAIHVDPNFGREEHASDEMQKRKIDFEMHFNLESTSDWVSAPDHFMLMNNGRSFKIVVDPTALPPGVHTARVVGMDSRENSSQVPMFAVPITVVKPLPIANRIDLGYLSFEPAEVKRFFVVPPNGATWMDITVKDCRDAAIDGDSSMKLFVLHTVQLLPHAAWRDFEKDKSLSLLPSQISVTSIAVEEAVTCEVALARYWSTQDASQLEVSIEFRGIRPVPNHVEILSGARGSLVRINSDLRNESVSPTAKLTKWLTPLRPKADPVVAPLGERDVLPAASKDIYQLVLEYDFEQEEKGAFTPRAYALQGVLYESAFESQLMQVYDGDKKRLGVTDAWPSEVTAPKGKVIIRVQVRHDDPSRLEKLKDMVVWIERSLEKDISLSIYPTKQAMMTGNSTFRKRVLRKGTGASIYISEPPQSKIPSGCKPGDVLRGSVTFASGDSALPGDGKRPGGYSCSYIVGPKPKKGPSDPEAPEPKDERTAEEKMLEAVRDAKVGYLNKLSQKEKDDGVFDDLYGKIESEYPDYLPLRMAKLKFLDTHKKRSQMLDDVVKAAEAVLSLIQEDELALHFGKKIDSEDPASIKERETMKEKKTFLIESLARLAMAYSDMDSDEAGKKFDQTLKRLKAWVDIETNGKYSALAIEREHRAGRLGNVLKIIGKLLAKEAKDDNGFIKPLSKPDLLGMRAKIFEKLGFSILVEYDKSTRVIASPKTFSPF